MNRLDWQELVDRITSAPAGSRELDVLIHVALFGGNELSQGEARGSTTEGGRTTRYSTRGKSLREFVTAYPNLYANAAILYDVPQLSTSIEACYDLQSRMIPSAGTRLQNKGVDGKSRAAITVGAHEYASQSGATLALAWAAALVSFSSIGEAESIAAFEQKIDALHEQFRDATSRTFDVPKSML